MRRAAAHNSRAPRTKQLREGTPLGIDAGNETHKQKPGENRHPKTPADNHVKPGVEGTAHFAPVDTIGSNNPPLNKGTGPDVRAAHLPPKSER